MNFHLNRVVQGMVIGLVIISAALFLGGCTSENATYQVNIPEPTNYVVDSANIIDDAVEIQLNQKLKDFSNKGEIAVLTVDTISPISIEEYGIAVGDKWKVGKAGLDNGAIIIIAAGDRKVRIETGRGSESLVTDAQAGYILDNDMVPLLKAGNWTGAVQKGVDSLIINMSK